MSKLFLPLRSNAAWFTTSQTRELLERRIKLSMLLYDDLIFQNGRYLCQIAERGYYDMMMPPDKIFKERTEITYYELGREFAFKIASAKEGPYHPLVQGKSVASFEIDYFPILNDAGLLGESYVFWLNGDILPEDKKIAEDQAQEDSQLHELQKSIPGQRYQQLAALKVFYVDSFLAHRLRLPFGVDFRAAPIIDWKLKQAANDLQVQIPPLVYRHWVHLELPDFTDAPWEDLHNLRQSAIGQDFRKMVQRISVAVEAAMPNIKGEAELKDVINREFVHEIVRELQSRSSTPGKVAVNLALNIIPYGSLPSTVKDAYELWKDRKSWVSLLHVPSSGE